MSPLAVTPSLLALAAAILRYQLFDIEVVLRRSLLYAGLTLCLFAVYATTVAVVDRLFRGGHTWASLAATALVAVLFAPLRQRLQQGISRLLYGERDHPDVIISNLSRRLEETPLPEQLLPQVVETVAEALRLPYVGIDLLHPSGREPAARYGEPVGTPLSLPLTYQGETIGWMLFGERARGEPFGKKDRRLLEDLARHIGAAAYAVRVTAELQRSREELVRAREEERRRLRRDLHDGLGPTLAAGILQLQVALGLIRTDPDTAEQIVSRLASEAKVVVEDIRRLVEALRPPALDQLGLVCAIQEQASHFGRPRRDEAHSGTLRVKVEADGDLQGLPAAVEVAAYRIVCEALNNASRHGGASACSVRLALRDEALEVEILDDGRGLAAQHRDGVGLASMRERAAELGGTCTVASAPSGGTVVHARLPLPTP
jgi:signal transduction histidine kinase